MRGGGGGGEAEALLLQLARQRAIAVVCSASRPSYPSALSSSLQ